MNYLVHKTHEQSRALAQSVVLKCHDFYFWAMITEKDLEVKDNSFCFALAHRICSYKEDVMILERVQRRSIGMIRELEAKS